jgi:hypothetical protein
VSSEQLAKKITSKKDFAENDLFWPQEFNFLSGSFQCRDAFNFYLLRNRGAEPKSTDFKVSAKDAFGRLREAFFCRFFGFSTQCRRQQFISTRDAHTLHTYFAEYAARRVGFKELAEDAFLRVLSPISPILRVRTDVLCSLRTHAHDAHVFSATDGEGKFSNVKSQPEAAL